MGEDQDLIETKIKQKNNQVDGSLGGEKLKLYFGHHFCKADKIEKSKVEKSKVTETISVWKACIPNKHSKV